MEEELFDTRPFGRFFVPTEVVQFLIDLTSPKPNEEVLGIGFYPDTLKPAIEEKTGACFEDVSSRVTSEELDKLKSSYDVILCAPTFGLYLDPTPNRLSEPNEEFWLKWSTGHLNPTKGRLAIVVPTGLLSNYSQQAIRQFLLEEAGLQAILELPTGWVQSTATQASILLITPDREPNRFVKMFRFTQPDYIPWNSLAPHVLAAEPSLPEENIGAAYTILASELDDLRLDAQYYDPSYTNSYQPDPAIFEAVKLAELVEIRSGERLPKEYFESEGVPFIQVGNISPAGSLNLRNAKKIVFNAAIRSRGYSQPGEILVTTAGTVGKVAFLGEETPDTGVCIDTSIRRLRVLDKEVVLPEYLALYLRSQIAQVQINRAISGSVIRVLSSPNLKEVIVYLPDIAKQHEIVETFHKLIHQQTAQLFSCFPELEKMQVNAEPLELKQVELFEQITIPLNTSQQLSWQEVVKKEFPFPISRAFTVFEEGDQSPSSRFKSLIDVSEAVVYYLYGILISDQLRRLKLNDSSLKSKIVTNFSIDRRIEFILYLLKLAKQNSSPINLFVPELIHAEIGTCSDIHNNLRNKYAHTTTIPNALCEKSVKKYQPKLEKLLQSLMPLKDYKLTEVERISVRNNRYLHDIVLMMGNNSLFQRQAEDLETIIPADTQHIVLIDQDYNVLDLHPFYLLYAWENTGMHYHLCFFKHTVGESPNQRLKVESTQGVGDTTTQTDLDLNNLLSTETSTS